MSIEREDEIEAVEKLAKKRLDQIREDKKRKAQENK